MAGVFFRRILIGKPNSFTFRKLEFAKKHFRNNVSQSVFKSKTSTSLPVRKIIFTMSCFGVTGGAYAYYTGVHAKKEDGFSSNLTELTDSYNLVKVPDVKPSRQVTGPASHLGLNMVLYQYQTCPFCCKVRAFLDFYGIPYNVVEVNPVMKKELKFSSYKKVPILIVHDKKTDAQHQLNDSSTIISILGTYLLNTQDKLQDLLKFYVPVSYSNDEGKKMTEVMNQYFLMYGDRAHKDRTDEEIGEERKWRKWADQEFVHVISPNIYRSTEESLQAFRYFSDVGNWESNFSTLERLTAIYVGATAMYFIGKKLKKKYALKDDVRESLYDSCQFWMKGIGKSKFMGGESPNLADLAVYGLLTSFEGCTAFRDLLKNTDIGPWYFNVKEAVSQHVGFKELQSRSRV